MDLGTGLGPDTWAGGLVHKVRDWESLALMLPIRVADVDNWGGVITRLGCKIDISIVRGIIVSSMEMMPKLSGPGPPSTAATGRVGFDVSE